MLYKQHDSLVRGIYVPTYWHFFTANASARGLRSTISTIVAIGGSFAVRYRRAEDVELAYRLSESGVRFVFDDKAIAYHYADRSFQSWLQNVPDYGKNEVIFATEHGMSSRLDSIRDEFHSRHPLVRTMTRWCVVRPWLLRAAERQLVSMAGGGDKVGAQTLTRFSLSGLYNLAYYSAMAAALGGARPFLELIDSLPDTRLPGAVKQAGAARSSASPRAVGRQRPRRQGDPPEHWAMATVGARGTAAGWMTGAG